MNIYIKKRRGIRQKYHFVIAAANGETIATSENYFNKADCIKTARLFNFSITDETV